MDLVDAHLRGDLLRGPAVVTGEHHHLQSLLLQRCDRIGCTWLDRVRDADHTGDLAVDRRDDRGLALILQPFCGSGNAVQVGALAQQQPRGADDYIPSIHDRPDAVAGDRLE